MAQPQPLFDYVGHLPECPTWSDAEQALYWADILECEIHRYDTRSKEHQVLQFPEEVGCFALREKGGFIVALRSGIWLCDARRNQTAVAVVPSFHPYKKASGLPLWLYCIHV
ncbi:SMP-30/gluconolactonase/LRE family protein [Klebsiella aerogenes]|nr:hypothetical protein AWI14_11570 [Klebsiella aerogenes]